MNKSQPNIRSCESRAASDDFWLKASELSLNLIWDNPEDDIYAELLEADVAIPRAAMSTFEEILSAALALPPEMRAMLADHLLTSLDGPDQKRIDALWAEEAERRLREIDEGKVQTIDGELVMQKLRQRRNR
jgi:putative addiction module component (TIGR02574 family)